MHKKRKKKETIHAELYNAYAHISTRLHSVFGCCCVFLHFFFCRLGLIPPPLTSSPIMSQGQDLLLYMTLCVACTLFILLVVFFFFHFATSRSIFVGDTSKYTLVCTLYARIHVSVRYDLYDNSRAYQTNTYVHRSKYTHVISYCLPFFFSYLLYKMFHMFNTQDWIINDGVFVSLLLRISSLVCEDLKWAKCWHPYTYFIHLFLRYKKAFRTFRRFECLREILLCHTYRRGMGKYTELKCNLH